MEKVADFLTTATAFVFMVLVIAVLLSPFLAFSIWLLR